MHARKDPNSWDWLLFKKRKLQTLPVFHHAVVVFFLGELVAHMQGKLPCSDICRATWLNYAVVIVYAHIYVHLNSYYVKNISDILIPVHANLYSPIFVRNMTRVVAERCDYSLNSDAILVVS